MKKVIRFIFLTALIVGGIMVYPYIKLYLSSTKSTINQSEQYIYVKSNTTLSELGDLLVEEEILKDTIAFNKVANYKQLTNDKIAAGKYLIGASTNLKTLINGFFINSLGNGNAEVSEKVTFNNCRDIYQLAGKVARFIESDSTMLVEYLSKDEVISHFGFSQETFASLFIPDTYEMYWDTSPEGFVNKMAEEYKAFWNADRKAQAKKVGLSQSQVTTLASIVYREQGLVSQEWSIIAGLYLNRLNSHQKLESDPTFRFCWGDKLDGVQHLTYAHRDIDCPYNTYKYFGLPPGPICIPPKGVLEAVLNPDKNNYIFMCAKPEGHGTHNFAHTYSQHLANAALYHRWEKQHNIR